MINILAEQPILVSVLLGLLAIALLYTWARGGGNRWLLVTGVLLLALIPVAWFASTMMVTDEEEIQRMIERFAADVEANDYEAAYRAIDPDHPEILERVRTELPRYEFTRARVGGYQTIRILPDTHPTEAVVDLIASVQVTVKGSPIQDQKVARRLLLRLKETPDGWKVTDYAHRNPIGAADAYSSGGGDWEQLLYPSNPQ